MRIKKLIAVIDSHTCGEPTRVVVGGAPLLKGTTMSEKWEDFKKNHDDFRRLIMIEPRGHSNMFGAVMVPPANPEADTGVIFCDTGGSVSMCGHGSMGISCTLVNLGLVDVKEPVTEIKLDTPIGIIPVAVETSDGEAISVKVNNAPAFVYASDCDLYLPSLDKNIKLDISFGGNFFAMVNAEDFGLKLTNEETKKIIDLGREIREEANKRYPVQHPLFPENNRIQLTEFSLRKDDGTYRNCVFFGASNVDRSPCGTGTCAKMAVLAAKGELKEGDVFIHESILGSVFEGGFTGRTKVGEFDAINPYIKGVAHVTGFNWLIHQEGDELGKGFMI